MTLSRAPASPGGSRGSGGFFLYSLLDVKEEPSFFRKWDAMKAKGEIKLENRK